MGFFDGFLEKKSTSTAAVARAVNGGFRGNTWDYNITDTTSQWSLDRALDRGYDRVVWVMRCVHTIASNQANVPIVIKDYTTVKGATVENQQINRLLNLNANPNETAWELRYRLSAQCLLSPLGAFINLVRAPSGEVKELYLLDPGTVQPIKDAKKWVKGYRVQRADNIFEVLDPEDVIWVRTMPHPVDPYRNVTPLESAGLSIETDYFARLFNRNFLRKDGRPSMVIGIKGDMMSEDAEEIKQLFSGGISSSGETVVIEADSIDVADLSAKPRDSQWTEAINISKENILTAFGVPESVLGNASGRCLRASEFVHLATGEVKRAEQLVGQTFDIIQPQWDGASKVVSAKAEYANHETIYKITTFSGRTLETNGDHPLYQAASSSQGTTKRSIFPYGWTGMKEIKAHFDRHDAHGTGTFTEVAIPVVFAQTEAGEFDYDEYREIGSTFKTVPDSLFVADDETQTSFLSGLYSTHGRLSQHTSFDLYPPSLEYSLRLQRLLLRRGVVATVTTKKLNHLVSISGKINMFNFLSQLDLSDEAAEQAHKVWLRLNSETNREHNAFRSDGLPDGLIWDRVLKIEEVGTDQTVALTVDGNRTYLSMFWEHNTYNNAESEIEGFWTGTMKTHCDSIAAKLQGLTGSLTDDYYLEYDYEDVDVIQKSKRRLEDALLRQVQAGVMTIDDYLIAVGRQPMNVPGTKVFFYNGLVIGASPQDVEAVRRLPVVGAAPANAANPFGGVNPFNNLSATGGDGIVGGFNDIVQSAQSISGNGNEDLTVNDQAARIVRSSNVTNRAPQAVSSVANDDVYDRISSLTSKDYKPKIEVKQINTDTDPHRDLRNRLQGFIEGSLEGWSQRQLSVVSDRLGHTKVRKGTRHWEDSEEVGSKDLDTAYIVVKSDWSKDISSSVKSSLETTLVRAAHAEINRLVDEGVITSTQGKTAISTVLGDDYLTSIRGIAENASDRILQAANNQSDLLAKHITVQDQSGRSISQIRPTLHGDNFDRTRWATALARKTTTFAIESLFDLIYGKVDGSYKIWCTNKNEYFRETHVSVNGKKLSVNSDFTVGSENIPFPAAIMGEEGSDCSCWLYYGVDR